MSEIAESKSRGSLILNLQILSPKIKNLLQENESFTSDGIEALSFSSNSFFEKRTFKGKKPLLMSPQNQVHEKLQYNNQEPKLHNQLNKAGKNDNNWFGIAENY